MAGNVRNAVATQRNLDIRMVFSDIGVSSALKYFNQKEGVIVYCKSSGTTTSGKNKISSNLLSTKDGVLSGYAPA
jgi:hypothetical protein